MLCVDKAQYKDAADEQLWWEVNHLRNVVTEMKVTMRCVKPIREARRELMEQAKTRIELV